MKTQYIAEDGETFSDEKDCASYELANCGLLEKLEAGIANAPRNFQKNWCGSGACACVGCINSEFHQMGLRKSHWQAWMQEYRKEAPLGTEPESDKSMDYEGTNLILKEVGDNRKAVASIIKNITGLGVVESYNLACPDKQLKSDIFYKQSKEHKKLLEAAGARVEIVLS